jgi:hypothetical protein
MFEIEQLGGGSEANLNLKTKETGAPIHCRNLSPYDSGGIARIVGVLSPDFVTAFTELWKDCSKDRPTINPPFQDLDVDSFPGAP